MHVPARVCIWVLGSSNLEALGAIVGPLRFNLWIVVKSLYSRLCLFDAIIELNLMDEEAFNDCLIRSESGLHM